MGLVLYCCRLTNIDWVVDGDALAKHLGMEVGNLELINDFVAQGYGILTLSKDDVVALHNVPSEEGAPIACLGAGTGLGQCFLCPGPSGAYECYPSEGGHAEWAPRGSGNDQIQLELLKFLKIRFSGWNRVSIERVVSSTGICNIYEFLAYRNPHAVNRAAHKV